MCQGKTAIEETKSKATKCYVVSFDILYKGMPDCAYPMMVFSSLLRAKNYIEQRAEGLKPEFGIEKTYWENDTTFYAEAKKDAKVYRWDIYETEIDDEVDANFHYPSIELENEVLRKECYRLRKELADVTQRNAVAATYATMWDGGYDYTKERVLDILHIVKDVLSGDHKKVTELFEKWLKDRETK